MVAPGSVRVLGQTWRVQWVSGIADHPLAQAWRYGHTDQAQLVMTIRDDVAMGQQQDTLLHEVIHAALLTTGQEVPEGPVWALTPVLLDVLRSNPELVAFLLGGVE